MPETEIQRAFRLVQQKKPSLAAQRPGEDAQLFLPFA